MRCRITRNGHIVECPRDVYTQILIESGLLEKVAAAPGDCNLQWAVVHTKNLSTGRLEPAIQCVCVACKILTAFFDYRPDNLTYVWHKREKSFPIPEIVNKFLELTHASEKVQP